MPQSPGGRAGPGSSPRPGHPQSANFDAVVAASRTSRLQEEMRVFYVAVTRAQHALAFVVSGQGGVAHPLSHRDYSWADELRAAWPALSRLRAEVA